VQSNYIARGFMFSLARAPPNVKPKIKMDSQCCNTESPATPNQARKNPVKRLHVNYSMYGLSSTTEATMNKISDEKKKQILSMLVEGNSIRSIERITNTHRDTIMRLMVRIGKGCEKLLEDNLNGFHSKYLQADEIWCYVKKKEGRLNRVEKYNSSIGDQYVFVLKAKQCLDQSSSLIRQL